MHDYGRDSNKFVADRIMSADDIDTKRFSVGPDVEVALEYWDHVVSYRVLRENSGHQVVVYETVEVDWSWHIAISSVVAIATVLVSLIFGMPIFYALLLGVLLGVIVIGLVLYEKKMNHETLDDLYHKISSITGDKAILVDEPIWENIKSAAQVVYKRGIKAEVSSAQRGFGGWLKRLRPMSSGAMNDVLTELRAQMSPQRLMFYHNKYAHSYAKHPEAMNRMGFGVKSCSCAVCVVSDELDFRLSSPGIARVREREDSRIYIGHISGMGIAADKKYRMEKQRTQAQKEVQAMDRRKEAKRQAELMAKRKAKAKKYVLDKMTDPKD